MTMKKGLCELVFILDRSGSMSGLESDTIGGYNSMLLKQKKEVGEAYVTTVLFDNQYELLHDRINIKGISEVTDKEYYVRGSTALLDAVGKTIDKIGNVQKHTSPDEQAEKVLFVIITDGFENASTEYSYKHIKNLIERQSKKYGWEFIFMGANIDAIETAGKFGIDQDRAVNYHSDREGTLLNYEVVNEAVSMIRSKKSIDATWKDRIDKDFNLRKGGK